MFFEIKKWNRFFLLAIVVAIASHAAEEALRIDYTVDVANIDENLFHVSASVKNIRDKSIELSLPVWTPGWYTLEEYARNVSRFIVRGPDGKRLLHERTLKQTWRVNTQNLASVTIEFDYNATKLALNQAKIDTDIAFFTGTELFLMATGHRDCPCAVTLKCPAEWRVISALKETDDPRIFTASNYDELVDCPVLMGRFDARKFDAMGKPHWFVSYPKGAINEPRANQIASGFKKIVEAGGALFGGLPYDKYVFFYFFRPSETRAAGGIEHANSHVCFFPHGAGSSQEMLQWMAAHEFFHVWNAKRIRPVQLWPYDYLREVETPLLWVSEGFTTYYGSLLLYRAGLMSPTEFYEDTAASIAQVESTPARDYISPAEASTATWLNYDRHVRFEISYYLTGRNLGTLLDLSILHDTNGEKGLDDVMRGLYAHYFLKNKGFDTKDLLTEIKNLSGQDYSEFFAKYVNGLEHPPYAQILNYAGMKYELSQRPNASGSFTARIAEMPDATDAQKKIRDAWLKK